MATQLAEAIRKSPQIEAAQDWKTVVNLNHGVTPSEASDLPYGRKITPVTLCNPLRSGRFFVACATQADGQAQSHALRVPLLVIPASAAFGTGGHATTAMSLRFLERLTREWEDGRSLADLGTGSGILALAAKRFGAGRVIGIDIDPTAISIAKANARLNKIDNADFQLADVRRWKSATGWDIIGANLYSELLIEILPKTKTQ